MQRLQDRSVLQEAPVEGREKGTGTEGAFPYKIIIWCCFFLQFLPYPGVEHHTDLSEQVQISVSEVCMVLYLNWTNN